MRFPIMFYARPAKPQITLRIRAVLSEPLLVVLIFNEFNLEFLKPQLHCHDFGHDGATTHPDL